MEASLRTSLGTKNHKSCSINFSEQKQHPDETLHVINKIANAMKPCAFCCLSACAGARRDLISRNGFPKRKTARCRNSRLFTVRGRRKGFDKQPHTSRQENFPISELQAVYGARIWLPYGGRTAAPRRPCGSATATLINFLIFMKNNQFLNNY